MTSTMPLTEEQDLLFAHPYVDRDEWIDEPVRHRYLHGGFTGTDTRFSLHLPPEQRYRGRFFHYITPVPDSEHLSEAATGEEDRIAFAITHGAGFLETNGGGPAAGDPTAGGDLSIGAYRANAAAARFARQTAIEMFGEHRVYGYAFGGSGGAFRTIGGAEATTGVWDGVVPYVVGSPVSIPNCFTPRVRTMRVLRDRLDMVDDALDAGGSGDPYAGLDQEQRDTLLETTRMGFPPRSWFGHRTMGVHAFALLYPAVRAIDPGYFEDFWTLPGYLGHDGSPSLTRDRVQLRTAIDGFLTAEELTAVSIDPGDRPGQSHGTADDGWLASTGDAPRAAVRLRAAADEDPQVAELVVLSGTTQHERLVVTKIVGSIAVLGPADPTVVARLAVGDEVLLDNSGFLAMETYHRHQVPPAGFPVWDQFRDEDGSPSLPQRPVLVGPMITAGASGGALQSGRFSGRMILLESLLDREAFPWQADWYRTQVRTQFGAETEDRFRVWMTDYALHGDSTEQEHPTRTVSYLGVIQQALLDLAAWVEDGVEPPASSDYRVVDGQVVVPDGAGRRRGVQPVARLTIAGASRTQVRVGEPVRLTLEAETPGIGQIVATEWDVGGAGFEPGADVTVAGAVLEHRSVVFARPGTWFVTARVTADRDGVRGRTFAQLHALARVRVVVVD